jgi:hypothetical protein
MIIYGRPSAGLDGGVIRDVAGAASSLSLDPGADRDADVKFCASQSPGHGLTVARVRAALTVAVLSTR